jgi:hypothetical protein
MKKFTTIMAGVLIFLIIGPMLSGCATIEEKLLEMKLGMIPWADDKEILLEPYSEPFHLGPLQYDEMLIALNHIK